jgi:hypothetical protein
MGKNPGIQIRDEQSIIFPRA